jgi:acyl carrier protein phosphodiesterase
VNYLAHIYLSFGEPGVTLGNFIADRVRGKAYLEFPADVQHGLLLHREIDTYTDSHPITRSSSRRLHGRYRHYSRVIVDIYYDHFLSKHWEDYSPTPLGQFTTDFYALLRENIHWMPEPIRHMATYMMADNWLLNYRDLEALRSVFRGMNRRTALKSGMDTAVEDLEWHYADFEREFRMFFEDLVIFSRQKLTELKT